MVRRRVAAVLDEEVHRLVCVHTGNILSLSREPKFKNALYQGNLNSKMRHKLKALVKEEALDAKPEQTLQQTMHSVNTRQEISSSDAGSVPGMGAGG